jgi:hypothetical protein
LDATSTAWFETFCGGLSGLTDLQSQASSISSPAQAGQLLGDLGTALTSTGQQLSTLPPPTFQGGQELATTAVQALQQVGPAFTEFGQKAAALDPNDQAAAQQFGSEFQQQLSGLQGLTQIRLDPDTQEAVSQIPACAPLFSAASAAESSSATTS